MTHPDPYAASTVARRRAGLILAGVAAVVVLVLVAVLAFVLGRGGTDPVPPGTPTGPVQTAPAPGAADRDVTAETELALRPMLEFPAAVASPHALTTQTAGPSLRLPAPAATAGRLVPGGFPGTEEGAVAQLAALLEVGFIGADPHGWAQAYESVALPGAPAANTTGLYSDLSQFRARAGLPTVGPVAELTTSYTPTSGLIKGTVDGGRYTVVCVLGELTIGARGQSIAGGAGSCQAMRYLEGEWRISSGAAAARAPLAWPGTAEAVRAGYRELTGVR